MLARTGTHDELPPPVTAGGRLLLVLLDDGRDEGACLLHVQAVKVQESCTGDREHKSHFGGGPCGHASFDVDSHRKVLTTSISRVFPT